MKSLKLKIYGKVQGVFFRINARKKAQELELTGWVENKPDETVEIEVQGKKESLEKFIQCCRQGSFKSVVEKVECKWQKGNKTYKDFVIKR